MTAKTVMDRFANVDLIITQEQAEQFVRYYDLLIKWNEKMNLTAITDENEVIEKHFIDSVLSAKVFDYKDVSSLIDVGTGAGFPGIPLKIMYPQLEVTLVDALKKRLQFLEVIIKELRLTGIWTYHGRAEDLAKTQMREAYDLCVSRAVSQLNVLCEYCLPFIKVGGSFISYKGAKTIEELSESKNAIDLLGGEVIKVTDKISLNEEVDRGFIIISKMKATPERYPRRAGKPIKKPL